MERSEAEAIYAQGREPVIDALLALSARLEAQDAQLAAPAERVEELEQRMKRDSRNSWLPPSHDPPWLGKRGRSRGTGRKQGAQLGHVGHGRELFPIERVTEVVEHRPQRCSCCHVFGRDEREPAGVPARHQVAELPPLAVEISEHRLQRLCCPGCTKKMLDLLGGRSLTLSELSPTDDDWYLNLLWIDRQKCILLDVLPAFVDRLGRLFLVFG